MERDHRPVGGRKKGRMIRRGVFLGIEIFLIAVLCVGIYLYRKLDKIDTQDVDRDRIVVNDDIQKEVFTGYTTIALFGLDNRDQSELENGKSDVMMIMSINNDTKDIKVVSVYRDTYLDVSVGDLQMRKANSAYSYGGCERAISMLNSSLDISIDNYVTFNFSAVAEAIDVLGGVDIEVQDETELYWLNKYIDDTKLYVTTSDSSHVEGIGWHHMSGIQAVSFARIRYTSGGDFKRAQRQRIVLGALIDRAKHANLSELNGVLDTVLPNIRTDLSKTQILSMIPVMIDYTESGSRGWPFYRTTGEMGRAGDVVIPCDLVTNVAALQEYLYGNENYTPSERVSFYNENIIYLTGKTAASANRDDFVNEDGYTEEELDESGPEGEGTDEYGDE